MQRQIILLLYGFAIFDCSNLSRFNSKNCRRQRQFSDLTHDTYEAHKDTCLEMVAYYLDTTYILSSMGRRCATFSDKKLGIYKY